MWYFVQNFTEISSWWCNFEKVAALVQEMAWCHHAASQCWPSAVTPHGTTRQFGDFRTWWWMLCINLWKYVIANNDDIAEEKNYDDIPTCGKGKSFKVNIQWTICVTHFDRICKVYRKLLVLGLSRSRLRGHDGVMTRRPLASLQTPCDAIHRWSVIPLTDDLLCSFDVFYAVSPKNLL